MSMLVVGAVTVPVSPQSPPHKTITEYGDFTQAVDGTDRGVIVARKALWTVTTAPMVQSAADALVTALQATPPIACSGTLTGAFNARGTVTDYGAVTVRGGLRIVVTFTLRQV